MSRKRDTNYIIGLVLTSVVLILIVVGFFYTPYDPNAMSGSLKNQAPSISHLFGTDNFGRDILSRVMEGGRTTFLIAIATVLIGGSIGAIIGVITGYVGGMLDEVIMRFNDILASFPSILLALIIVSITGVGKYNIILALSISFIPSFARVMRSEYVACKQMDYVKNARIMGVSHMRIMFVHILPNTLPILWSSIAIGFNNAVLAEAGMSYLGLGVQPPDASLGRMLAESQTYMMTTPWYTLAPGILIIITVLGVSLVGEHYTRLHS
ncbi:dipeptide transport system permease protein DppC [Lachnospiraceae bacterium KM106-2]|nr:dipeptide transport system permease protein DppC [Lachnospiraceae bacterium KM106-2]